MSGYPLFFFSRPSWVVVCHNPDNAILMQVDEKLCANLPQHVRLLAFRSLTLCSLFDEEFSLQLSVVPCVRRGESHFCVRPDFGGCGALRLRSPQVVADDAGASSSVPAPPPVSKDKEGNSNFLSAGGAQTSKKLGHQHSLSNVGMIPPPPTLSTSLVAYWVDLPCLSAAVDVVWFCCSAWKRSGNTSADEFCSSS